MKTIWLVRPRTFSDPIAFESEADANEYIDMTSSKDEGIHSVCCLFVPSDKPVMRGYSQLKEADK